MNFKNPFATRKRKIFRRVVIPINGCIDDSMYEMVYNTIMKHAYISEIVLTINSGGGNTSSAFAICDLLTSLNVKITTVAIGRCQSMATVLFALGTKRYISKNSKYMLHQCGFSFGNNSHFKLKELLEITKSLTEEQEKSKAFILTSCQKDLSSFLDQVYSSLDDTFLSFTQVLDLGLATDLLENSKPFK